METIITARKLGCDYSDENDATRRGIFIDKLDIPAVGITTIIGPSGSGKSTLLTLLSGIREPNKVSEDSVLQLHFDDKKDTLDLLKSNLLAAGKIGFVFQDANLIKEVSGYSNATIVKSLIRKTSKNFFLHFQILNS